LWRKLLPDLEDDLQGIPNEEINKSKIPDMMYAMRNINENNIEELLQSDACEMGFQHMTDTVNAAMK
jgi:hypothetical protein